MGERAGDGERNETLRRNREILKGVIDKGRRSGTLGLAPNGKKSNLVETGGTTLWGIVRMLQFKAWFGDWEKDAENASKVVDENGEPLVVYHGSRSGGGFNVFRNNAFFTDSKAIAQMFVDDMAGKITVDGESYDVPRMYLDDFVAWMTNGDEDAEELATWGDIDSDGWYKGSNAEDGQLAKEYMIKILDTFRPLDEQGNDFSTVKIDIYPPPYSVFLNIRNPLVVDFKGKEWGNPETPEDYLQQAKEEGRDGMIVKNIIEGGLVAEINGETPPVANDYIADRFVVCYGSAGF